MSEQTEVYREDESHVPDPTSQYGTMDTSGTAGAAHSKLENVTPIFEVADAQNAMVAAAALDPDQPDVPGYLVTMPPGQNLVTVDEEAIKERLATKAKEVEENPVLLGGPSPYQKQAAEEGEQVAQSAENQRTDQGGTSAGGKAETVSGQGTEGAQTTTGQAQPQAQRPAQAAPTQQRQQPPQGGQGQ